MGSILIPIIVIGGLFAVYVVMSKKTGTSGRGLFDILTKGSLSGNQPHILTQSDLDSNEDGTVVANNTSKSACEGFKKQDMGLYNQCIASSKMGYAYPSFAYYSRGIGSRITTS